VSEISDAIATGTGTDCMAVLSLGKGERIRFAGKHTKIGELIACAAIDAMNESVERRLAAYRRDGRADTI
jgi:adenosylcobinamide amidohydrolase